MCSIFFACSNEYTCPPPPNAHTARGLIRLKMYVCVCGLCVVGFVSGGSGIGAGGAKALAAALERNSSVKSLKLYGKCQSSSRISDGIQIV